MGLSFCPHMRSRVSLKSGDIPLTKLARAQQPNAQNNIKNILEIKFELIQIFSVSNLLHYF